MKKAALSLVLLLAAALPLLSVSADGFWYQQLSGSMNINLQDSQNYNKENSSPLSQVASMGTAASQDITFSTDTWFFVSLDDPYARIPFGLKIVITDAEGKTDTQAGYDDDGSLVSSVTVQAAEGSTIDVYLILPDTAADGEHKASAGDYRADITVTTADKTPYSLLLSGYYEASPAFSENVIFSVYPAAGSKTINIQQLLNGEIIDIAEYDFTSVTYNASDSTVQNYFIYALGSSFFDDERASYFQLTNINDPSSHFRFNVFIKGEEFNGFFQNIDADNTDRFLASDKREEILPDGTAIVTYYSSGSISIKAAEDISTDKLSSGYYEADIYLHVVSLQ